MNRKLSAWSKPGEKPPCVGVWETRQPIDVYIPRRYYNFWNGRSWSASARSPKEAYKRRKIYGYLIEMDVRFRGLAEKPE